MLFTLPWDVRAIIWATARRLEARDALAAHLPARARRQEPQLCWYVAEARFVIGGHKMLIIRRTLYDCFPTDHTCIVSRDLETVRVLIPRMGFTASVCAGHVVEEWVQQQHTGSWQQTVKPAGT